MLENGVEARCRHDLGNIGIVAKSINAGFWDGCRQQCFWPKWLLVILD